MNSSSNLKRAVLEALRLIAFAIPGILIQVITNDPQLTLGYGSLILVVLKAIDRSIHDNPNTPAKGLLPF